MSATLSFEAPLLAGRFRLLRRLGAGGMGEVWSAELLATGELVAIKLLPKEAAADPAATARFELEARTLCRVDHERVVRVIDFGIDPERGWFLATELLEGETLAERLERTPILTPAQVVRLGVEILDGLEAVHAAGVVHRDLKPENVMLVPGADGSVGVRLLDFGIAKLLEPGHRVDLTVAGQIFGTPAYISPEQALGRPVDARSDLYACGVILYRALAGRLPFDAPTPAALALLHASEPLPPLPEEIPGVLRVVVEQALAKDPEERFGDAAEMRAALAAAWPESEPLRIPEHRPTPRPAGTGAVPRLGLGASRTLLAVRLTQPGEDGSWSPGPIGEGRSIRLTPPAIVREVIEAFGGRIAGGSDERILAEFESPTDTLQCAAAIHDRIAELAPEHGFAVDVRAAVTAGEVVRSGRSLHGQAVDHAAMLARSAYAGEVLFTHGVYLAMTRSEVAWEPWPGRDPGVGQKLYRLCEPADAPRPELPYGGATLHRLRGARRMAGAGRLAEAGISAWLALAEALERLLGSWAGHGRRFGQGRVLGLLAGLVLLAAAARALWPAGPAAEIEELLRTGQVERARAEVERWLQEEPERIEAQAYKGSALAFAGQLGEARLALRKALQADPSLADRETVARAAVRTLDERGADRSLVLENRTPAMERSLFAATRSIRYWERWNAVRSLEKLGLGEGIDWVEVYLLDLRHAGSCGTRMQAARKLAELGDPRAIETLLDVRGTKMPGWACNLDAVIDEAVAKLRQR